MNYKYPLGLIAASCLAFSHTAMATDFDLRISDDTVQGAFSVHSDESEVMLGIGYLYKDASTSINVLNIDMHAKGQTAIANLPTTVGVGIQGNVFKQDSFNGSAVGIGGTVRINLPDAPGLSIESEAHYAPDILAYNDADDFTRFRLQTNYRIISNADVSFGYRYLNAGVKDGGDETLESGVFLGMKLKF